MLYEVEEADSLFPFGQRVSFFPPVANSTIHRNHVRVTHLLQIISRQRRAESSAAVEHNRSIQSWYARLDITLDDALAQVNRAGQMVVGEFALFAHIYQHEWFAAIYFRFHFRDTGFAHASLRLFYNFQKARRMLRGHAFSFYLEEQTT